MNKMTMKKDPEPIIGRRRFVTLRSEYGRDEVDLEMPGNLPLGDLLPDLIKALNWPTTEHGQPLQYILKTEAGIILQATDTLIDAGIENSDVLWISLAEETSEPGGSSHPLSDHSEAEMDEGLVRGFSPVATTTPSPKDRRGTLAPPRSIRLPIEDPSLVSKEGVIFVLGDPPISIGRTSRGQRPDIDLSELDTEIVSSRHHAEIHKEGERYLILALQTTNGTFINGVELMPEERQELEDGDLIQFGYEGIEMTFWSGSRSDLPASFFT